MPYTQIIIMYSRLLWNTNSPTFSQIPLNFMQKAAKEENILYSG